MKLTTEMKGRDFLSLLDFSPEELTVLLDTADALKRRTGRGIPPIVCPAAPWG